MAHHPGQESETEQFLLMNYIFHPLFQLKSQLMSLSSLPSLVPQVRLCKTDYAKQSSAPAATPAHSYNGLCSARMAPKPHVETQDPSREEGIHVVWSNVRTQEEAHGLAQEPVPRRQGGNPLGICVGPWRRPIAKLRSEKHKNGPKAYH